MDRAAIDSRRRELKGYMAQAERLSTSDARVLGKAMTDMCLWYGEYARLTVAQAVFETYRALVERTPADTGRARASWNLGTQPEGTVPPPGDYPEFRHDLSVAVDRAIAGVGLDADTFCIASDLDYMPFLESGWSGQAPAGFIALTLREFAERLGRAAGES